MNDSNIQQTNNIAEITRLHSEILAVARLCLDKAMRIGELLSGVKQTVGHGNWLPWLDANVPFSHETAQRYMRCWHRRDEMKSVTLTDLTSAYRALAVPRNRITSPDELTDASDERFLEVHEDHMAEMASMEASLKSGNLSLLEAQEVKRRAEEIMRFWHAVKIDNVTRLGAVLIDAESMLSISPWPELRRSYPDMVRLRQKEPEIDALWQKYPDVMELLAIASRLHIGQK